MPCDLVQISGLYLSSPGGSLQTGSVFSKISTIHRLLNRELSALKVGENRRFNVALSIIGVVYFDDPDCRRARTDERV